MNHYNTYFYNILILISICVQVLSIFYSWRKTYCWNETHFGKIEGLLLTTSNSMLDLTKIKKNVWVY